MKIYFVRHGQTEHNKTGVSYKDDENPPITEEGIEQVTQTREQLPDDIDIFYSSDSLRCRQTSEILNKKLNLPIIFDERLQERKFGALGGTVWNELHPDVIEKDRNVEYDYRPHGGEFHSDVRSRVNSLLEEIKNQHYGKKVLVVTSGGIIRALHSMHKKEMPEKIHNASLHEFEFLE